MDDRDRDRFGLPEVSQNTSFSEDYEMEQQRDPTGDLSDTLWDMIGHLQQEIRGLTFLQPQIWIQLGVEDWILISKII